MEDKDCRCQIKLYREPAKNYHLVSFDYEPKQITIAAPDDMLESLDSITLDSVSIEGLTEDYEKDIDLTQTVLPDNVILANDDTSDVKVKATIEKDNLISFPLRKRISI